jgi:hypothetical protein
MASSSPASKQWRFFGAGGFDQVRLETGSDRLGLDQLDFKLWVALACRITGLEFDKATLALIDTDKDGRVRAPELSAAVKRPGGLLLADATAYSDWWSSGRGHPSRKPIGTGQAGESRQVIWAGAEAVAALAARGTETKSTTP